MPLDAALRNIHRPESVQALNKAQERLKFDELFFLQLNILRYTKQRNSSLQGFTFNVVGEPFMNFYNNYMPFPLTGAQKRVIKEIRNSMRTGRQMNRLLQGDVGSGKTELVKYLTKYIPDNAVVGGVPAKVIKTR